MLCCVERDSSHCGSVFLFGMINQAPKNKVAFRMAIDDPIPGTIRPVRKHMLHTRDERKRRWGSKQKLTLHPEHFPQQVQVWVRER